MMRIQVEVDLPDCTEEEAKDRADLEFDHFQDQYIIHEAGLYETDRDGVTVRTVPWNS